jgi:DHA1 family bicyclomycin/chloramphenicol resistance-like MFS transporter
MTSLNAPAPNAPTARLSRYAIVLGLLTAIGPSAIDMYLPALPAIGRALGADAHAVQASLMAFFVATGAGQLVAGPLSDMFGRKRPMYVGLAVFVLASIGCALAPGIGALIAFRFLQGLGACACMVTPRAVVRDLHTGTEAARLMSLLILVYSVSPILAPLVGSLVAEAAGWRAVFWVIGALAGLAGLMVALLLPETRPAGCARAEQPARRHGRLRRAAARPALSGRGVHGLAHAVGLLRVRGQFVVRDERALRRVAARVCGAVRAERGVDDRRLAVNGRLSARFGIRRVLRTAVIVQAGVAAVLLALTLAGVDRLGVLVALLMVVYGLNGVIVPSAFVVAMEGHAARAGTASALLGTLNFAGGAVVVALVSPFADGTPLPMVAGIGGCSFAVLVLALRTLGRVKSAGPVNA